MKFRRGLIADLWIIDIEPKSDHRGFFARAWCEEEFAAHGMEAHWPQQNLQQSPDPGTMRGLHYQVPPHSEVKLVRCTRGAVFDVAVDLRPESPTYRLWSGTELRSEEHRSVWVPRGCAHGYVTLEPNSEVFYLTSHKYVPRSVRGIKHDDPAFRIEWPRLVDHLPPEYESWPDFTDELGSELSPLGGDG